MANGQSGIKPPAAPRSIEMRRRGQTRQGQDADARCPGVGLPWAPSESESARSAGTLDSDRAVARMYACKRSATIPVRINARRAGKKGLHTATTGTALRALDAPDDPLRRRAPAQWNRGPPRLPTAPRFALQGQDRDGRARNFGHWQCSANSNYQSEHARADLYSHRAPLCSRGLVGSSGSRPSRVRWCDGDEPSEETDRQILRC